MSLQQQCLGPSVINFMPSDKTASSKIIFLFLNQSICFGYSKEPSQLDGSF